MVVPSNSGCLFDNTIRQCIALRVPSPSHDASELSNHTLGFDIPASFESVTSQWALDCSLQHCYVDVQGIMPISKGGQWS